MDILLLSKCKIEVCFFASAVWLAGSSVGEHGDTEVKMLDKITGQLYKKTVAQCSEKELYASLIHLVRERAGRRESGGGKRKLYYISAEFLIGRLLSNNLINLGIYEEIKNELEQAGKSLADLEEMEPEPSLGNGGLGRLAACFLDSVATLGLRGDGIGLNYHMGLFRQVLEDHKQRELPDRWIGEDGWEIRRDNSYTVNFGDFSVRSTLYDIEVIGYENRTNRLHLFDLDSVDDRLVKRGISFDKRRIQENLTLFLYPDDSDEEGRLLRLYQQYFMVSNAAQFILEEAVEAGCTLKDLQEYVMIQINDTHPSLIIPELIRLLTERGMKMKEAVAVVTKCCAYTNHTILAEALEKWPLSYIKEVAPALAPVLEELDARAKKKYPDSGTAIIDMDNRVHMAHLAIHYCRKVNGVARLHTEILKEEELKDFYRIYPEKFTSKTNGITFRRWLLHCNRPLADWIRGKIGDRFIKDAMELNNLLPLAGDIRAGEEVRAIKRRNKEALAEYLKRTQKLELDPDSVFDIQAKRLHEYKRQQLNALFAIHKYLEIRSGKRPDIPITMIFAAKAAPAYTVARDIIHLILCLQTLIERDADVSPWLRVVMVENYNVTVAEKLIPACDISEQISLASREASGTGNMKFMLNGAITLGTRDGANAEIEELVGADNIYIFGEGSDTVLERYREKSYSPLPYYKKNPQLKEAVDFIISPRLRQIGDATALNRLYRELVFKDWFMTFPDFSDYLQTKERALRDYQDSAGWAGKMIINTAKAGYFSADRTVAEYNRDIWHLQGG